MSRVLESIDAVLLSQAKTRYLDQAKFGFSARDVEGRRVDPKKLRTVGGFDNAPCALCARETPCECAGGPCACDCGRCQYPYPLPDDGPLR